MDSSSPEELTAEERDALHEIELGIEHLHRAHGHLVTFHHNTGRATDHLDRGEDHLREAGYTALADELREEHLPRGVITITETEHPDSGLWSYELLENFEDGFLRALVAFGDTVTEQVAGGLQHAAEREQEQAWRRRAHDEGPP